MENIRYVNTNLKLSFETNNIQEHKKEFDLLGLSDEDAVGEWLKLAKARGETGESDQVLLTLLVELHRKVDALANYVKGEEMEYLSLQNSTFISGIGYENFKVDEEMFEKGAEYYGRVEMPIFPKREIPVFFTALDEKEISIKLMHERDEKDWNAYIVARERAIIREMRAKKS